MRIALYQMNIVWENRDESFNKLKAVLEEIKDKGVELLLMPEMSFTGFSMNTDKTAESDYRTLTDVKKLAVKYKLAIGVGWAKKCEDGKCENHYSIVGPDEFDSVDEEYDKIKVSDKDCSYFRNKAGVDELDIPVMLDYVKIHPFSFSDEDKYFKGGDFQDFLFYKNFNISAAICYDLRFPEIFQTMSKKAELIIVPANWPDARISHWKRLLKARAIENQCYIAGINCIGKIGGTYYSGESMLINPDGEALTSSEAVSLLAESDSIGTGRDEVFIYDIENDVSSIREAFPVKNDRKEELYIELMRG